MPLSLVTGRGNRRPNSRRTKQLPIPRSLRCRKQCRDILSYRQHPQRMQIRSIHPENEKILRFQNDRHPHRQHQRQSGTKHKSRWYRCCLPQIRSLQVARPQTATELHRNCIAMTSGKHWAGWKCSLNFLWAFPRGERAFWRLFLSFMRGWDFISYARKSQVQTKSGTCNNFIFVLKFVIGISWTRVWWLYVTIVYNIRWVISEGTHGSSRSLYKHKHRV